MKLITTLFLMAMVATAISEDFINGAAYIKSAPDNFVFSWIGQNTSVKTPITIGKTYESDKEMFELMTVDQQEIVLKLSSGMLIQVNPNSEYRLDAFNQMVANVNTEPALLKAGDFILNSALMNGSAYFIAPKYTSSNTMCVLQTPLMNLELNGGKYHIKASPKFTAIYTLEGSVGIFDNQSNKKTIKPSGTMAMVVPSPMHNTETLILEKTIDITELQKLNDSIRQLETSSPKVMFVISSGKIIGVKLE